MRPQNFAYNLDGLGCLRFCGYDEVGSNEVRAVSERVTGIPKFIDDFGDGSTGIRRGVRLGDEAANGQQQQR